MKLAWPALRLSPLSRTACHAPAVALAALVVAACGKAPETPAAPAAKADVAASPAPRAAAHEAAETGIAWKQAANDGEIDAAFAVAKSENKPVFVYWGAKWCPPCNQVKATLFNRQDFIERSRAFVPVYVDGDSPGAQKIGARFQGQRLSDDGAVQRRRARR